MYRILIVDVSSRGIDQVTSTLLRANSSTEILDLPEIAVIRTFLQSLYDSNHGVIGYGMQPYNSA